jgi:AraC family transcriptional regulator, transcriptional activator of the genes for pyochelin and ferripyochelin receptors
MKTRKTSLSKSDSKRIEEIRNMITSHPGKAHTLTGLAALGSINRTKLSYGFRQLYGCSVHQYLVQTRMTGAQKMLRETDVPVKAIARHNGYGNTQNFITAFRKFTGTTPSRYRSQNTNRPG